MTPLSACAVRAAKSRHSWGRHATLRYLVRHHVPLHLYQLACALAGEPG